MSDYKDDDYMVIDGTIWKRVPEEAKERELKNMKAKRKIREELAELGDNVDGMIDSAKLDCKEMLGIGRGEDGKSWIAYVWDCSQRHEAYIDISGEVCDNVADAVRSVVKMYREKHLWREMNDE